MMISGTYERPNPTTVTEALQGTKEVLQRLGRGRNKNFLPDGRVCLYGAARVAVGLNAPNGAVLERDRVLDRIGLLSRTLDALNDASSRGYYGGAVVYNDRPETTDEDMYTLIDAAIAAEGQEGDDSK
jgi:hypothetical protein